MQLFEVESIGRKYIFKLLAQKPADTCPVGEVQDGNFKIIKGARRFFPQLQATGKSVVQVDEKSAAILIATRT